MSLQKSAKTELLIDAAYLDSYLSKTKMRTTFVAFAILLILGMIQVRVG